MLIDKSDFNGIINTDLICSDNDGYKYKITYDRAMKGKKSYKVHKQNPYSIYNINHYLFLNNVRATCISHSYIDKKTILEFVCDNCGTHIFQTWSNTYSVCNTESSHIVLCPKCGGRTESLHACILKQLFKHYYPDTIEEEKSCINPKTGKIMPTDIVNHRLKIAIEIQSEWHDNDYSRYKDSVKRDFWISSGYSFYSPDIRDYSILEMCQIFFDIEGIPDFVNTEYSNKINVVQIQSMLNLNKSIPHIAKELDINIHRIYDAIYSGKIVKPSSYINADCRPIVQLDRNGYYINEFNSIADAATYNGISSGTLVSALTRESHYSKGYFWFDKKDYYDKNIPTKLVCRFKNAS